MVSGMERMLKLLEQNARLSVEELAAMLGVTAEEVALQMDKYRRDGVIRGFNTLIDWDKTDVGRVQAVIELRVRPKKDRGFDDVAAAVAAFEEVESLLLMSGGYDLQVVMRGKSFQDIALFVAKRLSPLDDVLGTATHFVLRTYKKDGQLFQDDEPDERETVF